MPQLVLDALADPKNSVARDLRHVLDDLLNVEPELLLLFQRSDSDSGITASRALGDVGPLLCRLGLGAQVLLLLDVTVEFLDFVVSCLFGQCFVSPAPARLMRWSV